MPEQTTAQRLQRIYEAREVCHIDTPECDGKARGTFGAVKVTFENGTTGYLDIALCPYHAKKFLGADSPR